MSFIIGISGGSCSGKTALCKILNSRFKERITFIKQDWYYKGGNFNTNFDSPNSIDFDLMISQVKELLDGKEIQTPIYDFATHSRLKKTNIVKPNKIIVIEGILIFYENRLRDLFNLRIYVDADMDTRYIRRLNRDVKERKRSDKEVRERWLRDVKPSHKKYIDPTKSHSHIIINNEKNTDLSKALKNPDQLVQIELISTFIKHKIRN